MRLARGSGFLVPLLGALTAATSAAQSGTIVGTVVAKGAGVRLGYSVIALTRPASELFTDADGGFVVRALARGRLAMVVKHIGYAPLDTVIDVLGGDTLHLRLELSLVTVTLPAVHSLAPQCAHPGAAGKTVALDLAVLFEQMQQNAERNRLLARTYPFELVLERRISKPEPALEARFVAFDTVVHRSTRERAYAPGRMLGTREIESGVFGGRWTTLNLPELADYADPVFLNSHCFDFGGLDTLDGRPFLRIDFMPAPSVHAPDVSGSIYLDPGTFQLRATQVSLVNLTRELRERIGGQSVRAEFREALPGVPVIDRVSSMVYPPDKPNAPEPSTEVQRTLEIRFLKGKP